MAHQRAGRAYSGWFAAKLRYVSLVGAGEVRDLIEDRIILLESDGFESAISAALARGVGSEYRYENALGEPVSVRFEGVVDLKELFDTPGEGAEVWWEFSDPPDGRHVADRPESMLLRARNATG